MSAPETQQAYAQGYHVGYQHGLEAGQTPILLIPQMILLWFLAIGVSLVTIIAWFAVVIMGSYPSALWEFMVGVTRWNTRLQAWMMGLTDKYPPFLLQ